MKTATMEIISEPTKAQRAACWREFKKALRRGDLVRASSCAWCGATGVPIAGHHPDYARPLMVVWLCRTCHTAHHREYQIETAMANLARRRKVNREKWSCS